MVAAGGKLQINKPGSGMSEASNSSRGKQCDLGGFFGSMRAVFQARCRDVNTHLILASSLQFCMSQPTSCDFSVVQNVGSRHDMNQMAARQTFAQLHSFDGASRYTSLVDSWLCSYGSTACCYPHHLLRTAVHYIAPRNYCTFNGVFTMMVDECCP